MSYDIYIYPDEADTRAIRLPHAHNLKGGTYSFGGTTEAWLNITYNYAPFFYKHIDAEKGIRFLYGKTGAECIPILDRAIDAIGESAPTENYWDATAGNARRALVNLRELCSLAPHGIVGGGD